MPRLFVCFVGFVFLFSWFFFVIDVPCFYDYDFDKRYIEIMSEALSTATLNNED